MLKRGVGPTPMPNPAVFRRLGAYGVTSSGDSIRSSLRLARVAGPEMSRDDIRQVLDAYVEAACMAKEGASTASRFTVRMVPADAFLWSGTNSRRMNMPRH